MTWNEACAGFPLSSVAVHVTVVSPTGKVEPEAGKQPTYGDGSTMSVAVGPLQLTTAPGALMVPTSMSEGIPWSTGAVVSTTVTLKLPLALRPPPSVTEHATVVVPSGSTDPGAGEQLGVGSGSSSASVAETPG